MEGSNGKEFKEKPKEGTYDPSRRRFLKRVGLLATGITIAVAGGFSALQFLQQPRVEEIRVGLQVHRTGIGADYGWWYERVARRVTDFINEKFDGVGGKPIKLIVEDDQTDPTVGPSKVEKMVLEDGVDFINGTLFSHVLLASVPKAQELKTVYFANSEDYGIASGQGNRYTFQVISDVRGQIKAISKWVVENLGPRFTLIYPDYAFGHYHRDWFSKEAEGLGGRIISKIAIPPDAIDFIPYISKIPPETDTVYHVVVGPGIFNFIRQIGELGLHRQYQFFGFVDSIEGLSIEPVKEVLEGTWFWEGFPRRFEGYPTKYNRQYRDVIGVDDEGRALEDPSRVSVFSHMHSVWESMFTIKKAIEESGWKSKEDNPKLIKYLENLKFLEEGIEYPQGPKIFDGRNHQAFTQQFISKVEKGNLVTKVKIPVEESIYEPEVDYRKLPL